ncbi:MAG: hypothetical protein MUE98_02655 [Rhodobacteraceae bacterium]|nr:hypothetical protein [Paracoccaceae bacterium]
MILFATYVLAPVAIYLSLATLPPGRPALIGIVAGLLALGLVWLFLAGAADDPYLAAAVAIAAAAAALAALVQGLRALLGPGRPRWVYPTLVALAFFGAGIPALGMLGL